MDKIQTVKKWLERGLTADNEIKAEKEIKNASESRLSKLYNIKREISECIHKVENPLYRTLLIERYINGKKWDTVADDMNYNERYIQKLHKKSLEEVCKIRHKKTV